MDRTRLQPGRPSRAQRGTSVLVVLVLLAVLLLGGVTMGRLTEGTTMIAGNLASGDSAVQASEIGINQAFVAIKALSAANEESDTANPTWYSPTFATDKADNTGLPDLTDATWTAAPEVKAGAGSEFSVRYYVDRQCSVKKVTDASAQCVLRQEVQDPSDNDPNAPEPPARQQFRVTVRVDGPKNTRVWVQSIVSK